MNAFRTSTSSLTAKFETLSERISGHILGSVRILTGLMWLANLHWKVPGAFGEDTGGGLYKYVKAGADNAPFAPYRWLLRELVLPNFAAFGWFTLISETVLAALLLIGYRSRLVALVGALMAIPIGLSVLYYPNADEWSWSYLMMIGLHLALFSSASGMRLGVDGVLAGGRTRIEAALHTLGALVVALGALGWYVARSIDFVGKRAALLGSDAGFVVDGKLTRRWELKFVWFNPMWALLTIVAGVLLIVAAKKAVAGWAASGLLAAMAMVAFFQQTFDYARDDGATQKIATGSNVAVWGGLALVAAMFSHALGQGRCTDADAAA